MAWIGTSGWDYPHWVGNFYPEDLPRKEFLAYYARHFSTIEINRSFYRLPSRDNFVAWSEQVGRDTVFRFAVKASRYVTHFKKLKDPEVGITNLMQAATGLEPRLGPILFQLPPNWKANPERLSEFVHALPPGQRAAFEFRHPSWFAGDVLEILDDAGCAVVHAVSQGRSTPEPDQLNGPFRYVRFHHGAQGPGISDAELLPWVDALQRDHSVGREAFVYFNNDPGGHAVRDAFRLRELIADRA